jgi:hypothetical protein
MEMMVRRQAIFQRLLKHSRAGWSWFRRLEPNPAIAIRGALTGT